MTRKSTTLVLSLILILLYSGCLPIPAPTEGPEPASTPAPAPLPQLNIPTTSEYSADLNGRVIIADKVKCLTAIAVTPNKESDIFWIVEVIVKNINYSEPVIASFSDAYKRWIITANDEVYRPVPCGTSTEPSSLDMGEAGKFIIHFSIPKTLKVNDAQVCYQGQEPFSYGKLTVVDEVLAYDWGKKEVMKEVMKEVKEEYIVPDEDLNLHTTLLVTIDTWSGTESEVIRFHIDKSPWVINGSYEVVSSIGHSFDYIVFTKDEYSVPEEAYEKLWGNELLMPSRYCRRDHCLIKKSGDFVIYVNASGVEWQLKVGIE